MDNNNNRVELFDKTFDNMENSMRIAAKRQAVIAQNIANANTPGYEAQEFDEVLGRAVKRQNEKKVIIEKEMADLSDNSIKHLSYVKLMSQKMGILRTIASQGKR